MVVGLGLATRLDAVYEQGSHDKGNPYPHHACPSIMLPGQARNESSGRTTQEINGHINGIDTVDGRCVKGYYAGLIRQMDALHTGINQQDGYYYPQVATMLAEKSDTANSFAILPSKGWL